MVIHCFCMQQHRDHCTEKAKMAYFNQVKDDFTHELLKRDADQVRQIHVAELENSFAAATVHEIRNPAQVIRSAAELLEKTARHHLAC